jgi:hypothetical protein
MTLSEGPGGVVLGVEVVDDAAEIVVGADDAAGAVALGALETGDGYCLVGGAVHVVVALVVVVTGGGGTAVVVAGAGGGGT